MSLRVCLECTTRYAVGLETCPQCGTPTRNAIYDWEDDVAKAGEHGATYYVPEGQPVPGDLPDGVRPVGPGAPPPPEPPPASAPKADWAAHAAAVGAVSPDEAQAMTKTELVETVKAAAPQPLPPRG